MKFKIQFIPGTDGDLDGHYIMVKTLFGWKKHDGMRFTHHVDAVEHAQLCKALTK